jgi:hypothetical protein
MLLLHQMSTHKKVVQRQKKGTSRETFRGDVVMRDDGKNR